MRGDAAIRSIGIVTAGRPALVGRALGSILRHCGDHGRRPRIIVVDGSRLPADRAATLSAVSAVADAGRVSYIGADEAAAIGEDLGWPATSAGPLQPGSAGINRNLLLLLTAGEPMLMIDDDVLLDTWALPDRTNQVATMGPAGEWMHTAFFDTRADALNAVAGIGIDLLATHESLLGQSVGGDAGNAGVGRVRVTMSGVAGDAGIYSAHRLLLAGDPLRTQLAASAGTLATALGSREVHRIARRPAVTALPTCMTTCAGIDNTSLVPPFPLVGTNEDGAFGAFLSMAAPDSRFVHLPVGIVHDSMRPSTRHEPIPRSAWEARLSDLLVDCLGRRPRTTDTPAAWMTDASVYLRQQAALAPVDLETEVERLVSARRSRELARLTRLAEQSDLPDHFRSAAATYRDAVQAGLDRAESCVPIDFRSAGSRRASYEALRIALEDFGHLMAAWPALWSRARERCARLSHDLDHPHL